MQNLENYEINFNKIIRKTGTSCKIMQRVFDRRNRKNCTLVFSI